MKFIVKIIKGILFISICAAGIAFVLDMLEERKKKNKRMYENFVKRPLDCFLAVAASLVFLPLIFLLCVLVRLFLGTPVFFEQDRPGKNGKIFKLYKFRTMTEQRDENGNLLPDERRLTPFGKMLRSTSLDELPELFNIIKGEMSLIGPRPLLVKYLPLYNAEQARRHEVRPGLTGLAQIRGRNSLSWEEKFQYDTEYVDNITFCGDLKIIGETIFRVLKRDGIADASGVTMTEFRGTKPEQEKESRNG